MNSFKECITDAKKRKLSLCPRGYCTAKQKFDVYPSAYANGYASSVCQGNKPDSLGETYAESKYTKKIKQKKQKGQSNDLQRWYREAWVNVCQKGDGPGGYALCGSGKGIDRPQDYPYCRAYYKLPGTTVVTAPELEKQEIVKMCKKKRSLPQGIKGKPTRVTLPKHIRQRTNARRKQQQGGGQIDLPIPRSVAKDAQLGIEMMNSGFKGGTQTGWDRAEQLATNNKVDLETLATMRAWYARHGPDAVNGGTSYPGYCKWLSAGCPMENVSKSKFRGAVAWLIWGGDAAYKWLKTQRIRKLLAKHFPNRKQASVKNNLNNNCK